MPPIKYPQLHDPVAMAQQMAKYGTDKVIAQKIGCAYGTFRRARRKMGLTKTCGGWIKYPVLHDPAALKQLLTECGSYRAVARKVGCQIGTVWYAVAKLREEERKE